MDDFLPPPTEGEIVPASMPEPRFWSRPIVLVLVSCAISCSLLCFGWKASMDTFSAVSAVKLQEHDYRLEKLEKEDDNRIKASDLALRDQLLDSKLSLLQAEIGELKDQVSGMNREHR